MLPTLYGPLDHKNYIVEAVGCGCAFIDYDNDGWVDIFLPSGTRREAPPAEATNRLYHNNRDGTFTDVTHKAGLAATGWASAVCIGAGLVLVEGRRRTLVEVVARVEVVITEKLEHGSVQAVGA